MRRQLLHAVIRSARRPLSRTIHSQRSRVASNRHGRIPEDVRNPAARLAGLHALQSSMHLRSFSIALVSTLVASGAYFAYQPFSSRAGADAESPSYSTSASSVSQIADATRRALIIGPGELYTSEIQGDAPLSKSTDDAGRKVLEVMTPDQATARLRRSEESFLVGRDRGVVRYDVVQLASNDPIEDDHVEKIVEIPDAAAAEKQSADWMFWGVFDGHSGWTTSAKLRQALVSYVARELNSTYARAPVPSPETIDAAIKRGFVALDTSIVHDSVTAVLKGASKPAAAQLLAPALSGSCALLSFYDSASKTLRVACTGDSRAVLGRRSTTDTSKWLAHPLSEDQTGGTPSEAARLRAEHPDEPNVVRHGRVLGGLEPSRAFGDATYKWTQDVQEKIRNEFFGRANPQIRTPPYVTAEPIVTTTKVQPEQGDFLVLATDGLWEMLTNEEVVGLVGQWLEKHPEAQRRSAAPGGDARAGSWLRSFWGESSQLPVDKSGTGEKGEQGGQRAPIRQQQWGVKDANSRFVVDDANCATHLVRNALGGADRDMVCALLTLPSPYSRRYRDDLTVEVIFFGEGDVSGDGKVTVNSAATAGGSTLDGATEAPKAKL